MSDHWILSPSILSADFACLGQQIKALEQGGADWIHIDVMDGHFVPNISMGPFVVETCRRITSLPLDVHLMIADPDRYVAAFITADANWLTVHVEACPHLYRTLQTIRQLGCHPGVALNPATPLSSIEEVLPLVDLALILGNNPGFSGQKFIPEMLGKITRLRELLDRVNPSAVIQVDGGMTNETLRPAYQAGARAFVAGNAVFKHPQGIEAGVRALKACSS